MPSLYRTSQGYAWKNTKLFSLFLFSNTRLRDLEKRTYSFYEILLNFQKALRMVFFDWSRCRKYSAVLSRAFTRVVTTDIFSIFARMFTKISIRCGKNETKYKIFNFAASFQFHEVFGQNIFVPVSEFTQFPLLSFAIYN